MSTEFTQVERHTLTKALFWYAEGKDPNDVITPELVKILGSLLKAYESDYKFIMESMTQLVENVHELGFVNREEIKECIETMKKEGQLSVKENITDFMDHFLDGADIRMYLAEYYQENVISEIEKETLTKQ